MATPFLKWAGGKRQIMSELVERFPVNIDKYQYYVEPFLGDVNACTKQEVIDACLDFSFSDRGSRGCAVQMADDLWAGEVEGPLALRVIECYSSRICGGECCVVPGY